MVQLLKFAAVYTELANLSLSYGFIDFPKAFDLVVLISDLGERGECALSQEPRTILPTYWLVNYCWKPPLRVVEKFQLSFGGVTYL